MLRFVKVENRVIKSHGGFWSGTAVICCRPMKFQDDSKLLDYGFILGKYASVLIPNLSTRWFEHPTTLNSVHYRVFFLIPTNDADGNSLTHSVLTFLMIF